MKKFIYVLGVVLIVALFASLYTYATAFHIRNVEAIIVDEDKLDIELDRTQEFIKKLESLKQYKIVDEHRSILIKHMTLDMKYGDDIEFEVGLDHDFSNLTIKNLKNGLIYLIDDEFVEWIYMQPAFDDVYDYKVPKEHKVTVNGDTIDNSRVDYHYTLANAMWYEANSLNESDEVITISDPELMITIEADDADTEVLVFLNNEEIFSGRLDELKVPTENGVYRYEVISQWKEVLYYGSEKTVFIVKTEYPPEFDISKTEMYQGEFIVIRGKHIFDAEQLFVSQAYMEGLTFEKNGSSYDCLIPSTYYTTPGVYSLDYGVGSYEYSFEFEVKERDFNLQYLTVSSQTVQDTQTAEAYEQYREFYKTALGKNVYQSEESHLSNQAFVLPVKGRISTEFGVQRYVNNKPTSYHHSGLDIAIDRGTEVKATYDGEVVLAMNLTVTGNTVVISHGNGIFSSYLHMDELYTEEGTILETGDIIGTVGTTGFSTGPHLHFTLSYYQMNLEPGYFIYGEPVTYDNYTELFN